MVEVTGRLINWWKNGRLIDRLVRGGLVDWRVGRWRAGRDRLVGEW